MPPASAAGYWGPITANYDWCEENYKYTPYVAEFFNTLTSCAVALAGVLFTRLSVRHQYGVSFLLAGVGLAVVGIGSIAFHGTLLREGQVLDEVPMLWSSLIFFWIALSLRIPGEKARVYAWVCLIYGSVSTYIYGRGGFEIFITAYVLTVGAVTVTTALHLRDLWDQPVRRIVFPYIMGGLGFYVGGALLLWVPEQVFCGNRLETSHDSGLLRLPVPLHAWFHLTSAAGPICWLTFATYESLRQTGRKPCIVVVPSPELCCFPVP